MSKGQWVGALLTNETRAFITSAFNEFCSRGIALTEEQHLGPIISDMVRRLGPSGRALPSTGMMFLHALFDSTQNAVREVYGCDQGIYMPGGRPKPDNHSTSWLKYVTFEYRPTIPEHVAAFLRECVNRVDITSKLEGSSDISLLLRVPMPLVGYEAFALTEKQYDSFMDLRGGLVASLMNTPGIQQLAVAAAFLATQDGTDIPHRLRRWMDMFSRTDFMENNSLSLQSTNTNKNNN